MPKKQNEAFNVERERLESALKATQNQIQILENRLEMRVIRFEDYKKGDKDDKSDIWWNV